MLGHHRFASIAIERCNAGGIAGLYARPRSGRPAEPAPEQRPPALRAIAASGRLRGGESEAASND